MKNRKPIDAYVVYNDGIESESHLDPEGPWCKKSEVRKLESDYKKLLDDRNILLQRSIDDIAKIARREKRTKIERKYNKKLYPHNFDESEVRELEADLKFALNAVDLMIIDRDSYHDKNLELKKRLEKLKCCGNCEGKVTGECTDCNETGKQPEETGFHGIEGSIIGKIASNPKAMQLLREKQIRSK